MNTSGHFHFQIADENIPEQYQVCRLIASKLIIEHSLKLVNMSIRMIAIYFFNILSLITSKFNLPGVVSKFQLYNNILSDVHNR